MYKDWWVSQTLWGRWSWNLGYENISSLVGDLGTWWFSMNLAKSLGCCPFCGLLLRCAEQEGSFCLRRCPSQLSWLLSCQHDGSVPHVALAEEPSNTKMLRWPSQGMRALCSMWTSALLAFLASWLNDDTSKHVLSYSLWDLSLCAQSLTKTWYNFSECSPMVWEWLNYVNMHAGLWMETFGILMG